MPTWLHNYFVRYGNSLITRGFIGIALLVGLIGYSRYTNQPARAPLWLALAMAAFFILLIGTGALYRNRELRTGSEP